MNVLGLFFSGGRPISLKKWAELEFNFILVSANSEFQLQMTSSFFKGCPGRGGGDPGIFFIFVYFLSLNCSVLDHSATAPPYD